MFTKELLEVLKDISESLRIISKREETFPVDTKVFKDYKIEVTSSNLGQVTEEALEKRKEQLKTEMAKSNHFFPEDEVDENLVTGNYSL